MDESASTLADRPEFRALLEATLKYFLKHGVLETCSALNTATTSVFMADKAQRIEAEKEVK